MGVCGASFCCTQAKQIGKSSEVATTENTVRARPPKHQIPDQGRQVTESGRSPSPLPCGGQGADREGPKSVLGDLPGVLSPCNAHRTPLSRSSPFPVKYPFCRSPLSFSLLSCSVLVLNFINRSLFFSSGFVPGLPLSDLF